LRAKAKSIGRGKQYRLLKLCKDYFVCGENSDINHLIQRRMMDLPKLTLSSRDARLLEDWWKLRVRDLLLSKRFQDADALYREFDVCETNA